jgi:hypothetical protein
LHKLLVILAFTALLCSCSNESPATAKPYYYKLELMHSGKVIRTINKTEVIVWRSNLIEFKDDDGAKCYWGGEFFAKEIK